LLPNNIKYIVIITTTNDHEEAKLLASLLVEEKAAACVTISSPVTSFYRWQGSVEQEGEFMLLIKTIEDNYQKVETAIKENHHYEVPEIIALPIGFGEDSYLKWIRENTEI
jgi:periplasmic divalent cation tolerance protein